MIVYLATSPSGKHYIGITSKSLKQRISSHFCIARAFRSKSPFHAAIRKYGTQIKWQVLKITETWEQACELERGFIALFNSTKTGYNVTLGGGGVYGIPCPEHVKLINSKFHTGRKDSPETQERRALAKGAKLFLVFKKDSKELVGEWLSQHKCARDLNIKKEYIWKCLNKKLRSINGFIFEYKEVA